MPELPEVETVVRILKRRGLVGRRVQSCEVRWERTVGGSAGWFARAVGGAIIRGVGRRGKYIVIPLRTAEQNTHSAGVSQFAVLLIHLRMSGHLYLCPSGQERSGFERVVLALDHDEELRFHDPRKFGRVLLLPAVPPPLGLLGIEPLGPRFSATTFAERVLVRRRMVKPLLLDQSVVAGLGNIYVDEALWEAELHPQRIAATLSRREAVSLAAAIQLVLRRGIENSGTSLGEGRANFVLPSPAVDKRSSGATARNQEDLRVFRRTGRPCRRCTAPIERLIVAQRSTHLCPRCQRM